MEEINFDIKEKIKNLEMNNSEFLLQSEYVIE